MAPTRRRASRIRSGDDGGYVLILGALLLLPLVVVTAFAVDLGAWYARGASEQRASDAASLAGVVWLPDISKATDVALQTAARNGYCSPTAVGKGYCAASNAAVIVSEVGNQRLRVRIEAQADLFFASLVQGKFNIARQATAEYVLSVPLGSPRNILGTGNLTTGGTTWRENVWLSLHGSCTDKQQGDQYATRYVDTTSCSGGSANTYYDATDGNYEYYIELPQNRSYDTDVIVYKGAHDSSTDTGDRDYGQSQGDLDTHFELFQVDATPLDDSDNPTMLAQSGCSSTGTGHIGEKTFDADATDSGYTFDPPIMTYPNAGSAEDQWWLLCRIPANAAGGRYILRVDNQGEDRESSNQYSLAATPVTAGESQTDPGGSGGAGGQMLCDARSDTTCPRVFAKDRLSYFLNAGANADFFLAEIGPEHAGKKAVMTLWDTAEGSASLEILVPSGTNSWVTTAFDYASTSTHTPTNNTSGTDISLLDTSGGGYASELITITIDIPADYAPPTDNAWWKVRYAGSGSQTVTDRTTWTLTLVGDPVRLVE